jgi:hypothetical protein
MGKGKRKKQKAEKENRKRNEMIEKLDRGVAILLFFISLSILCAHVSLAVCVCARASIRPGNVFPLFCPFPFCVASPPPPSHSSVSFLEQTREKGKNNVATIAS